MVRTGIVALLLIAAPMASLAEAPRPTVDDLLDRMLPAVEPAATQPAAPQQSVPVSPQAEPVVSIEAEAQPESPAPVAGSQMKTPREPSLPGDAPTSGEPTTSVEPEPSARRLDTPPPNRALPSIAPAAGATVPLPGDPNAPAAFREGAYIVDRLARLVPAADGREWVVVFEADGRALGDAPLVALPNRKLAELEATVGRFGDRLIRISGTVTEYKGRNFLLLEKATPLPPGTRF